MANKRDLKKGVKQMVYDIMDECDYAINSSAKGNEAAEKLMDEVVEFHDAIVPKINGAKDKAACKVLREEIEKTAIDFVKKTNALS